MISLLGFQGTLWSLNIRMVPLPSFVRQALMIIMGQFMQLFGMSRPISSESTLEEDGLRLVSINKKYKDKFAPYDDDPRIVGKIVGNFMPLED